jgi:hypothetical protein
MNNVIFNNQTYMETYIKQNVGQKSNPVFNKVYINEWDKYFVSWEETTNPTQVSPALWGANSYPPLRSTGTCLISNATPFSDIVFNGSDNAVIIPDTDSSTTNRFIYNTKTKKITTKSVTNMVYSSTYNRGVYISKYNKIYCIPCRRAYTTAYGLTTIECDGNWSVTSITDTSFVTSKGITYLGGCYDEFNNRIWMCPNDHSVATLGSTESEYFHYINIATNDISHITNVALKDYFIADKYSNAIYVDKKVYYIPSGAINTDTTLYYLDVSSTPTFVSYSNVTDGESNVGKGHYYYGGVLYDKKIFLLPRKITNSTNNYTHYIDTVTNTIHKVQNTSGILFDTAYNHYLGGCLAPDGYIYLAPHHNAGFTINPFLHRINVLTREVEKYQIFNNEYYRYNSSGVKISMPQPLRYFNGCRYNNGKVYFIPSVYSANYTDYPFLCYLDLNLDKKWNNNIHLTNNVINH